MGISEALLAYYREHTEPEWNRRAGAIAWRCHCEKCAAVRVFFSVKTANIDREMGEKLLLLQREHSWKCSECGNEAPKGE